MKQSWLLGVTCNNIQGMGSYYCWRDFALQYQMELENVVDKCAVGVKKGKAVRNLINCRSGKFCKKFFSES